jgi:hypothetical protein
MTQTVQPRSRVFLHSTDKGLDRKPKKEDNMSLLLSIFDSLNNLYEKLNRLNYVIQRKNMELNLYWKGEAK